jgi:hypothetical protein
MKFPEEQNLTWWPGQLVVRLDPPRGATGGRQQMCVDFFATSCALAMPRSRTRATSSPGHPAAQLGVSP